MSAKIKSPERLVFFSDAVVAIAMTLLVLPLADLVKDSKFSIDVFHSGNQWIIYSFLLSFIVIMRFWLSHHRIFENVKAYSHSLMMADMAWLLSIVILPASTEMVAHFDGGDRLTHIVYVGNLFVSSVMLTVMEWIIRHDPEIQRDKISDRRWFDGITTSGTLAVVWVLMTVFPSLSYYPLLLNILQPQVVRLRFRGQ
jgi:uncharacterized membrane protein